MINVVSAYDCDGGCVRLRQRRLQPRVDVPQVSVGGDFFGEGVGISEPENRQIRRQQKRFLQFPAKIDGAGRVFVGAGRRHAANEMSSSSSSSFRKKMEGADPARKGTDAAVFFRKIGDAVFEHPFLNVIGAEKDLALQCRLGEEEED